jgi:hypothetical protein
MGEESLSSVFLGENIYIAMVLHPPLLEEICIAID